MRRDVEEAWKDAPEFKDIRYPGQGPGPERIEAIVKSDEKVLCILKCVHTEKRGKHTSKTLKCTAVVTDREIYIIKEGTFTKQLSKSEENIPVHTITGIEVYRQIGMGTVVNISRADNSDKLIMCNETQAQKFNKFAKELISKKSTTQGTMNDVRGGNDALEQIKKLKALLDSGVISNDEFDAAKRKLLDKI
jgi:hypothetical protein